MRVDKGTIELSVEKLLQLFGLPSRKNVPDHVVLRRGVRQQLCSLLRERVLVLQGKGVSILGNLEYNLFKRVPSHKVLVLFWTHGEESVKIHALVLVWQKDKVLHDHGHLLHSLVSKYCRLGVVDAHRVDLSLAQCISSIRVIHEQVLWMDIELAEVRLQRLILLDPLL